MYPVYLTKVVVSQNKNIYTKIMNGLLVAIVGDIKAERQFDPPLQDSSKAKEAAEQIGIALAKAGARLLVYGGPFLEADVVRGFVSAKPKYDKSILAWYTGGYKPPPFPEEAKNSKLFDTRIEKGKDWEVAFYRAIAQADGILLMGGGNATKISGLVAIGARIPLIALREFGGGAAQVWEALSAGEDLPNRDDIDLMAKDWNSASASDCVKSLIQQYNRRQVAAGSPKPILSILAGLLCVIALAIIAGVWGKNEFSVWMLFLVPLIAGGAGAAIRCIVDSERYIDGVLPGSLAKIVMGCVAGGMAAVMFVTAQLTANPDLISGVAAYAQRSIPYAMFFGFLSGLTSSEMIKALTGLDVLRLAGENKIRAKA